MQLLSAQSVGRADDTVKLNFSVREQPLAVSSNHGAFHGAGVGAKRQQRS